MSFQKELAVLKRRIERMRMIETPPTLRMVFVGANDPRPEDLTRWDLLVRTEGKGPYNA